MALPHVRSGLGRGASLLINGAGMPERYIYETTGQEIRKAPAVAPKPTIVPAGTNDVDCIFRLINLLFSEVINE